MYTAWSYFVLLVLALIIGGCLWFVMVIVGEAIFTDFLGRVSRKIKRKRDEDDYYVY